MQLVTAQTHIRVYLQPGNSSKISHMQRSLGSTVFPGWSSSCELSSLCKQTQSKQKKYHAAINTRLLPPPQLLLQVQIQGLTMFSVLGKYYSNTNKSSLVFVKELKDLP